MRVLVNTVPANGVVVDYQSVWANSQNRVVRASVGGGRSGGLVDVRTKTSVEEVL